MLKTRSLIAGITLLTLSLACGSQVGLAAGANYESAECKSYINSLTQKLNNNWYIPDGKNKVTVTCTLESDGTAQDVVTVSVPGSPEAEQAANTAFVQAQPF
ncbi:MAG: cell envelope integrity protein TolA, partial [Cyanobacteriota/Melainabacteria group bacterium]